MRRISQHAKFRADLRRQRRRGKDIEELIAAVELLAETGGLPEGYGPHQLSGEWKGVSECHIDPDWLPRLRRDARGSAADPHRNACRSVRVARQSRLREAPSCDRL